MMNSITRKMLAATAGLFCATAASADFDGSEPLMCSLGQIVECDYGAECRTVTNESIDASDFVRLDFRKKQYIGITAGEATEPGDIDSVEDLDNHLIVQGAQGSSPTDTLAWSVSINQTTGRMTFTASGDDAGFVAFGACTTL